MQLSLLEQGDLCPVADFRLSTFPYMIVIYFSHWTQRLMKHGATIAHGVNFSKQSLFHGLTAVCKVPRQAGELDTSPWSNRSCTGPTQCPRAPSRRTTLTMAQTLSSLPNRQVCSQNISSSSDIEVSLHQALQLGYARAKSCHCWERHIYNRHARSIRHGVLISHTASPEQES